MASFGLISSFDSCPFSTGEKERNTCKLVLACVYSTSLECVLGEQESIIGDDDEDD